MESTNIGVADAFFKLFAFVINYIPLFHLFPTHINSRTLLLSVF